VSVADEGPGVPTDAHERIFERFGREDPARARSGGAGLGLAICREIVHAHGGQIRVEPQAPRGSVFVVTLPNGTARPDGLCDARAHCERSDERSHAETRVSG
jgi:signal transduction histidine kinase